MKLLIILLGFLALFYLADITACNKPGSFADKINWAGHKTCKETR